MIHSFIDAMLRDRASALCLGFAIGMTYATFVGLAVDRDTRDEADRVRLRARYYEAELAAARAAEARVEVTP